jgi:hypothetical protein
VSCAIKPTEGGRRETRVEICVCLSVSQSSDSSSGLDFCSLPSEVLDLVACVLTQQGFLFFFCSNCLCRFFSVYCRRSQVWAPCPQFSLPSSLFLCQRCCLPSNFIFVPESHAVRAGCPLSPAAARSGLPVR